MPTDELELNECNVIDESKFTLDEKANWHLMSDRLEDAARTNLLRRI